MAPWTYSLLCTLHYRIIIIIQTYLKLVSTVYPKKYAHGSVVLCFVVVMQSSIMNSHEVFIHIHQGCFAGTGAIVRLPQCQWSKPDGYGKISQCITTTKHSKAKTACIFLGICCTFYPVSVYGYVILSNVSHAIYGAMCIQLIHLPCDDCEIKFTLSYYHNTIRNMSHLLMYMVGSLNSGKRCLSSMILYTKQ